MPYNDNRAQQKEDSSFLAKTQSMKSHGLFVYYIAPNFLFLPIKAFSFLCGVVTCTWLAMVADHKLQFSANSI